MSVLIDSDIVIEVLRGRNPDILALWTEMADSEAEILVTPITIAEVLAGAYAREIAHITQFFAPLTCVAIDEQIGQLAGEHLRQYGKSHGVEIADALIAASAQRCQAALWTRNWKHYPMAELKRFG